MNKNKRIRETKPKERKREMTYPSPLKLDIACGSRKAEGFIGIDSAALPTVDVVHDLEVYPWPFENDSVDEARCVHYIEHTADIILFMEELYRIMKVGAQIYIQAPYYNSMRAMQDPTHKRMISEASFLYYNKEWRKNNQIEHYPIKSDFDFNYGYIMPPEWATRCEETRSYAIKHYTNVVYDLQATLTKRAP